jgi:hypothetical protein
MKISVERSLLVDISETLTMYGIPYPALNNLLKDNPDPPPPCAIKPPMETLDETIRRLEEAALNWKPRDNPQWNTAPTHTTVSRQDLQQIDDMLTEYYNKSPGPEGFTVGQQITANINGVTVLLEWDGSQWVKSPAKIVCPICGKTLEDMRYHYCPRTAVGVWDEPEEI